VGGRRHGLEGRGYIERAPGSRGFRLGMAIQALAERAGSSLLATLATPALAELSLATGETVNLAVLSGGRIVYAATRDGTHVPRMPATVGQDVEPHATAIGKAILSALPARERAALLGPSPYPAFTPQTITDSQQ